MKPRSVEHGRALLRRVGLQCSTHITSQVRVAVSLWHGGVRQPGLELRYRAGPWLWGGGVQLTGFGVRAHTEQTNPCSRSHQLNLSSTKLPQPLAPGVGKGALACGVRCWRDRSAGSTEHWPAWPWAATPGSQLSQGVFILLL